VPLLVLRRAAETLALLGVTWAGRPRTETLLQTTA
jgi:hypothetical protein